MQTDRYVQEQENKDSPGFFHAMMSVLAAAFGVQSSRARVRDFTSGSPLLFIASGLFATVLFVLIVILIVHLVLN